MPPWTLPVAAAGFGAGVLLLGGRVGPGVGVAAIAAGAFLLGVGWRREGTSEDVRRRLAEEAGTLDPPGPRERILAATGIALVPPGDDPSGRSVVRIVALAVALALAGGGWAAVRRAAVAGPGELDGRWLRFQGTAASDLRRWDTGWGLEVKLARAEGVGELGLRVWTSGSEDPPDVQAGEPVAGTGTLRVLSPEQEGFEEYLRTRGVRATLRASDLRGLGPARTLPLRVANAAREALRRGAFAVLPDREAGLLLGLTIGDTTHMDPEVDEDFRATGLGHLLAVSGSNVAMFLAPILGAAILLGARPGVRFAVGGVSVAFFALVTRWEPSVLRASAMALLALVGVLAGRPRSTAALLGGAVLGLLVADPALAQALAFQLSVAATVGLATMAAPVAARLVWLPRPAAIAAAATISAQAAVTPVLLAVFGVVPTVTLVANVLAFPAVPLSLFAGIAAAVLGLVSPAVGSAAGEVARVPIGYLIEVADRTAHLPFPSLTGGGVALPTAAGLAVAAVAWRLRGGRGPATTAAAAVLVAAVAWAALPGGHQDSFTVTFLDVGQGDAAVVRTPEGAAVLVDAGPDEQQVATDLAALGVRRLDLVIASHAHADHVEGFPAILSRFPVGLLLEPGCPGESPSYHRLLRAARAEDVEVRHPRGGDRFTLGNLEVEVLGPDECELGGDGPNDDSLVVRLRYGEATVLFPGDAEEPAQQDLLDDGDPIEAVVLKVPHHGGATSLESFFDAVGARVAVVSTGPNTYGHPVPSVIEALEAAGAEVRRTDEAGHVTIGFRPGGMVVESAAA